MTKYLQQYANTTILITGGAGSIGSNLAQKFLTGSPKRVMILDDLSSAYEWNIPRAMTDARKTASVIDPRITFIKGSVTDDAVLATAFSYKPDYVFHLAALFANQNSIDHTQDDLMVNGMGTLKVLEHSRDNKVKRFIFASSGCSVYGSHAPLPLKEDFVSIHLDAPYQITKLLGELYCNFFYNYYKLPVTIPRFFNVYGPGEVPGKYRNVIPIFIYRALKGEKLRVFGTGQETRDFTYVGDVVNGLVTAGVHEKALGEAFNFASGVETDIKTLAETINTLAGNKAGLEITGTKRDWDQISRRRASIEKAQKLLGYEPHTNINEGLENIIAWFKTNWDNIERSASF